MRNFLIDISKLIFSAVIVLILGLTLLFFLEGSTDTHLQLSEAQHTDAWLSKIENVEEKGYKAETLSEICSSKNIGDEGWCTGYMLGFAEGHSASADQIFCLKDEFSSDQLAQIFSNFMEDNPQHWGKSRSAILTAALIETFPCSHLLPK